MSSTLDTARAAQDGLVRRMAAILYQDREAIEGAGGAAYARWQQDVRTVGRCPGKGNPDVRPGRILDRGQREQLRGERGPA